MSNQIQKLSVENFLSFNTRQTVDFSTNHLSCFVGHNGSGKTNLLLAISKLANCYLNPAGDKRGIGPSFDQQKKPTTLSIDFLIGKDKYSYTIESLSSEGTVLKEELRNNKNNLILDMELHSDVGELSAIEKERITTYPVNEVGIFHLLFSGKIKIQNKAISVAVDTAGFFFQNIIFIDNPRSFPDFDYEEELYENKETKEMTLNFMNRLNYEIDDVVIEKITGALDSPVSSNRENRGSDNEERIEALTDVMVALKKVIATIPESQRTKFDIIYKAKFLKRPYLKNPISINLESEGVQRLIEVLTWIYANKNSIILIDELEKGFHELLVISLIKEVNAKVNQFIFTSHLLELMTRECLTKNQLFSVVKEKGQSKIYPLSEIENIRDDRHSLKNLYRAGKIPGYPIISEG